MKNERTNEIENVKHTHQQQIIRHKSQDSRKLSRRIHSISRPHSERMRDIPVYIPKRKKSEARSTKSETNPKFKIPMFKTSLKFSIKDANAFEAPVLNFVFRSFEFVSNFDIRISDLKFLKSAAVAHQIFFTTLKTKK